MFLLEIQIDICILYVCVLLRRYDLFEIVPADSLLMSFFLQLLDFDVCVCLTINVCEEKVLYSFCC